VPALPWKSLSDAPPDAELTAMASRLPLHSHASIVSFLSATLKIRKQLAQAPGLVGYALDAHIAKKTFYTLSAWTSREALDEFARTDPHHTLIVAIRPKMDQTEFVFWTCSTGDVPLQWSDARRRLEEAGG
jgi:quinol monooxygenase YgiN